MSIGHRNRRVPAATPPQLRADREVALLGPALQRIFPVDRARRFSELVAAIDHAELRGRSGH